MRVRQVQVERFGPDVLLVADLPFELLHRDVQALERERLVLERRFELVVNRRHEQAETRCVGIKC